MEDPIFTEVTQEQPELVPEEPADDKVVNTLLLGVADGGSDTMIVVRLNKENNKMSMVSIPRDTMVNIPGYGNDKINAAIVKKEGVALSMKTVSNLLGIPIHYYVKVDFKGAAKIFDAIGGVRMNVPKPMDYDDPAQDLHIHIPAGDQVLDGENCVKFLRFRSGYANQDLGRIEAQQKFIKSFANKMMSPAMIPKFFNLIDMMTKYVKTNLDQNEIMSYAVKLSSFKTENLKQYTVPGDAKTINHVAYFVSDSEAVKKMVEQMNQELGITNEEAAAIEQESLTSSASSTQVQAVDKKGIKIEILNSTGKSGLAAKLKQELLNDGYESIKVGDTKDLILNSSRIIDRKGNKDRLDMLSKDSGIDIIEDDIDNSYEYDITIVIGKDRLDGGI